MRNDEQSPEESSAKLTLSIVARPQASVKRVRIHRQAPSVELLWIRTSVPGFGLP